MAARPRAVSTFFNPQFSTHLRDPGHRTARWVVTGVTFVAYALLPLAELGLIGSYVQTTLRTEAHIDVPWWLIGMIPATAMVMLGIGGIRGMVSRPARGSR